MKEKWFRLCLKHKMLAFALYAIPVIAIYTFLMVWIQAPTWLLVVVDAFLLLVAIAYVSAAPNKLLQVAVDTLYNYCDYEPLYKETLEQQPYRKGINGQVVLIDYCVALSEMGEYEKVVSILEGINIDKYSAIPQLKYTYYHNLADAHWNLNHKEQFEIWYQKAQLILNDIKNAKMQEQMRQQAGIMGVQAHLIREEYVQALEALNNVRSENKRKAVGCAWCAAKAYLALGETEKAMDALKYVVYNGNKLHIVAEANALLQEIGN